MEAVAGRKKPGCFGLGAKKPQPLHETRAFHIGARRTQKVVGEAVFAPEIRIALKLCVEKAQEEKQVLKVTWSFESAKLQRTTQNLLRKSKNLPALTCRVRNCGACS